MDNFELNTDDLNVEPTEGQSFTEPQATEQAPAAEMFKYTAAGKEIEEDRETILKRASMGYHYAQNMQNLKAQREAFEQERQQKEAAIRESESRWSEYDNYAKANPEWANFVRQQWENRTSFNGQTGTQGTVQGSPELQSKITQLENQVRGFMESQKREKEDAVLNDQISQTRADYSDIDFNYSDPESGKSLEFQVLEHMQAHGLHNFRAAFRDFYHDKLLARAVTKAKEETGKQLQERQQQGYVTESDTPTQGLQSPAGVKSKSYQDLIAEGMQELGLT